MRWIAPGSDVAIRGTAAVVWLVVASTGDAALARDEASSVRLRWTPATAPDDASSPSVVPFRDAHALRFATKTRTRFEPQELKDHPATRGDGALTVCVVAQLSSSPAEKTPIVSKWHMRSGGRAWEIGVFPDGRVFLDVSASGDWPERARELVGYRPLEVGVPYAIVAVIDPGRRLEIFVNGGTCGKAIDAVPGRVFRCDTPILIGAQPPAHRHFDGLVAELTIAAAAWTEQGVQQHAREVGLTKPPAALSAAIEGDVMDLAVVRREVMAYVDELQVDGEPIGVYRRFARPNALATLYATTDVAWIRACMGEDLRATLSDDERAAWVAHINSFARDDGAYAGGRHSLLHANGMVVGALAVLGGRQKHPVRLYDPFDAVDEIDGWLEEVRWERQWGASHLFWGGMHCFSLSRRCSDAWRDKVFDWLDSNLDPQTGWWRKGVPQAGLAIEVLGGAAHIWPVYQHHGRRFPYPRRVIDSILAMQRADGSWLGFANYMELDALYGLAYMTSLAPDYRAADIARAAQKHGRLVRQRYPAFLAGRPDAHIVLSVVGTLSLLQELDPEHFRDEVTWSDIFSDRRFYETSRVEVLEESTQKRKDP